MVEGKVGTDKGVFVATDNGKVGVLKGSDCVNCAWTVSAAAVNTAFDASVGVAALEGRLQAESIKMRTVRIEEMRTAFSI